MVPGRRAMRFLVLVVAMFAFGDWAGPAMGQSSGVTVLAGASTYDLSGVGNAVFRGPIRRAPRSLPRARSRSPILPLHSPE